VSPPAARLLARACATLSLLVLFQPSFALAQAPVTREYQLKAAFIYNFTRFVEWPSGCFADEKAPIIIGIVGNNPFGDELEKIIRGRSVYGRSLMVIYFPNSDALRPDRGALQVLFFAPGQEAAVRKLSARLRQASILTVGETELFGAAGGVVNFTLVGDNVRFDVNLKSAEASGLKVSAQLLKLAAAVLR
jgi:hypothetical protein